MSKTAIVHFNGINGPIVSVAFSDFHGIPSSLLGPLFRVARKPVWDARIDGDLKPYVHKGFGFAASQAICAWAITCRAPEIVACVPDNDALFTYTISSVPTGVARWRKDEPFLPTEVGGGDVLHVEIRYMGTVVFSGPLSDAIERRAIIMIDAKGERNGRDEFRVWDVEFAEKKVTIVYADSFTDAAAEWEKISRGDRYSSDRFRVCVEKLGETKRFLVNEITKDVNEL